MEHGFDEHLYCSCGAARVRDFAFRCSNEGDHEFEVFAMEQIPALVGNLRSFDGLTILVLGETGVGKSTFINGFANYLKYNELVSIQLLFQ